MPLSPPVGRQHLHTRRVTCQGFFREDGLWDIEGRITDEKSYEHANEWRGPLKPGEFVHDMSIRLTLDHKFTIVDGIPASLRGRLLAGALVVLHAGPGLLAAPGGHLSYFNLLAGGREGGHRVLLDSNLDWGQDLPRLADWMRSRGVRTLQLGYHGSDDPRRLGIDAEVTLNCGAGPVTVQTAPFVETGTGWFVDGRGWVVTNGHVVDPAHRMPAWVVHELKKMAIDQGW